jgi:hypothetical protein
MNNLRHKEWEGLLLHFTTLSFEKSKYYHFSSNCENYCGTGVTPLIDTLVGQSTSLLDMLNNLNNMAGLFFGQRVNIYLKCLLSVSSQFSAVLLEQLTLQTKDMSFNPCFFYQFEEEVSKRGRVTQRTTFI